VPAAAAATNDSPVFRSVNGGGEVLETALSEKVVWQLIRPYAETAGVAGVAPHDCRCTCVKLCRAGASWGRFKCCSATPHSKPPNGISA
jgi:hypothetical protein